MLQSKISRGIITKTALCGEKTERMTAMAQLTAMQQRQNWQRNLQMQERHCCKDACKYKYVFMDALTAFSIDGIGVRPDYEERQEKT